LVDLTFICMDNSRTHYLILATGSFATLAADLTQTFIPTSPVFDRAYVEVVKQNHVLDGIP